jgi:hypothetical protein
MYSRSRCGGVKPNADGADAAGVADGDGEIRRQAREGHAGTGEGVAYAEALRETGGERRDGGHGGLLAAGFQWNGASDCSASPGRSTPSLSTSA